MATSNGVALKQWDGSDFNEREWVVTRGGIVIGNSSTQPANLVVGGAGQVLTSDGTDVSWQDPGGAATGTTNNTFTIDSDSSTGKIVLDVAEGGTNNTFTITHNVLDADYTVTFQNQTGTVALLNDKLSDFAATTSAELISVISDETGSGSLTFATSPTFTTSVDSSATFAAWGSATALTIGAGATTFNLGYASTAAATTNIATGATTTGQTKTINLGTGGDTGSTTNVNIGSANGGTITMNAQLVIAGNAPSTQTDTGTAGEIAWDGDYFYACIASNDWRRTAMAKW